MPESAHSIARALIVQFVEATSTARTRSVPGRPIYLVVMFAIGLGVFVLGVMMLIVTLLVRDDAIKLISSALLAVGSVTVVLALLRGQDIDERSR